MPEFPLPSFGLHIDDSLGHATALLNLLDEKRFLWVLLVFYIVVYVARWAIGKLQRPPSLGA
jgi:hypothetical protein